MFLRLVIKTDIKRKSVWNVRRFLKKKRFLQSTIPTPNGAPTKSQPVPRRVIHVCIAKIAEYFLIGRRFLRSDTFWNITKEKNRLLRKQVGSHMTPANEKVANTPRIRKSRDFNTILNITTENFRLVRKSDGKHTTRARTKIVIIQPIKKFLRLGMIWSITKGKNRLLRKQVGNHMTLANEKVAIIPHTKRFLRMSIRKAIG